MYHDSLLLPLTPLAGPGEPRGETGSKRSYDVGYVGPSRSSKPSAMFCIVKSTMTK